MFWVYAAIVVSVASFLLAGYLYYWVKRQPGGNKEAEEIAQLIRRGANAFLRREYKILAVFASVVAFLILLFLPHPIWKSNFWTNFRMALTFLFGASLSATAGKIGMDIATIANLKSAVASKKGIAPAFEVAFKGGAVMGMAVVGCSLFGAAILYLLTKDPNTVLSFSFGASTLALFAKAGGGIYTKTADVSADLVGKVELGIPEDDPRNPAVIADNVGDNVGDVAGMGADLFDSNIASIAAAMVIGLSLGQQHMVFCYATLGLLASILGVLFIGMGKHKDPGKALNTGTYITTVLFAVLTLVVSLAFKYDLRIWGATMVGLIVAVIIGITSDYFTGDGKKPVEKVAKASSIGPAFTILSGFSYGLLSCFPALLGIGFSALVAYKLCEPLGASYAMFGISMAAIGMLSIVGMIISNDAFGPIVDNARGLVEMAKMGDDALVISDELDAAGNTAKAITKGFAIGAAGLTVIALLGAYRETVMNVTGSDISFNIMNPLVFFGIMVGLAVPAVFAAMLMLGVDRNAERMVAEIHRQFETIPGLKEGKEGVRPEYEKCIDIATIGAIKELIPAGLMAIVVTLVVGFIGGIHAIGGFLTGNIVSGLFLALLMANSGGLWDNSKKYIETGVHGGKGSDAHKAAVIGDTVGDPFKDTAGPSLNTQVTVVSLISSLAANLFIAFSLF
ncbi:sodium-translocating pyrophosphatase [Caldicoprobacter faecalis]|uniref:K(+)-insensitive pyrophosphate-energized proton pump n=1 Tax=Caldicoprobacter faecalis TaxID=937334 RepID=A0A1I5VI89_9FIRM|nr:sodium-translocating pyrophosphatase [Caldicoprobacter faecalis]SFQ07057.1 K(+)-stimulated pyrophosphate-energized sodium pump [Caldicoprobacter faecalis]